MGLFGNSGGGGGLRWIIALVVAGVGLFSYMMTRQANPVTGQSQHVGMTPQQEIALGLEAAPKMAAQMGGEVAAGDPRARLVSDIGNRLVAQIRSQSNQPSPWQFAFHLLDDTNTVNAFALPGGQVFITTALFDRLQNEAQLAGVLGHEIGHVIERHAAEHMAKGQLGQSLATAVAVGASDDRGNGQMAGYAAMLANQMLQLKYGRDDETESDGYGVNYMAGAGYDPREMIEVMRILKEASGGRGGPSFLSTHPDPGNRAEHIGQLIAQAYPNGIPTNLSKGQALSGGTSGNGRWIGGGTSPARNPAGSTGKERW